MNETARIIASEQSPVRARLRAAMTARVVGRERELGLLEQAIFDARAPVVFVHGLGGIGKTSLLDVAEVRLAARGCRLLRFEGLAFEPTPAGFLAAVSGALGSAPSLAAIAQALESSQHPAVVLAIDEYDGLRLIDAWLRREFVPSLPAGAHMLFLGRSRPVSAWTSEPGWTDLVRTLELGPLCAQDARRLLEREHIGAELRPSIERLAAGHPLALRLAAVAIAARPDLPLAEIESRHVISELVRCFLSDAPDPATRAAVEAASVLRRVTRPLLVEMLGASEADAAIEALMQLPFVEPAADGLVLHQLVRSRVASALRSLDPCRHQLLRTSAWRALREQIKVAPQSRRWQVTADVLYLCEHAGVREAFFPSDVIRFGVEPARPNDEATLREIVAEHAGADEARLLALWWEHAPQAFHVVRDQAQRAAGVCVAAIDRDLPLALVHADPVLGYWMRHRAQRVPDAKRPMLIVRAALSKQHGARPSEERACCYLDIKRSYLQHLDLAGVYFGDHGDPDPLLSERVGFEWIRPDGSDASIEANVNTCLLRFPDGVLAFFSGLVDALHAQQPTAAERPVSLDRRARELRVDGRAVPLTRLEFGVLDYLESHAGEVASRDQLLEVVWGQAHTGSNVVDAVMRTLRKKLGAHAVAIRTITGFGYKFEWPC
jgi:hypothetical protein